MYKERLKTAASNINIIRNNMTNRKIIKSRKQKWGEKLLYEFFKQQIKEIALEMTRTWLRKENLKIESELHLIAA